MFGIGRVCIVCLAWYVVIHYSHVYVVCISEYLFANCRLSILGGLVFNRRRVMLFLTPLSIVSLNFIPHWKFSAYGLLVIFAKFYCFFMMALLRTCVYAFLAGIIILWFDWASWAHAKFLWYMYNFAEGANKLFG